MTRGEMLAETQERYVVLRERYNMYVRGLNESGKELSYYSANNARSLTLRDMRLCSLVIDLLTGAPLSEESLKGFEKLVAPYERHRQYRGLE